MTGPGSPAISCALFLQVPRRAGARYDALGLARRITWDGAEPAGFEPASSYMP